MKKIYAVTLLVASQILAIACGAGLYKLFVSLQNGGHVATGVVYHITITGAAVLTLAVYVGLIRPRLMGVPVVPLPGKFGWLVLGSLLIFGFVFLVFIVAENPARLIWHRISLPFIAYAAAAAVYPAVLEEILYRDMLLRWTLPRLGLTCALLLQGLLFALSHAVINRDYHYDGLIGWGIGSIFFSVIWIYTRNVYFPILLHFTNNFFLYIFNGFGNMNGHYLGLISGAPDERQFIFIKAYQIIAIIILLFLIFKKSPHRQIVRM